MRMKAELCMQMQMQSKPRTENGDIITFSHWVLWQPAYVRRG